MKRVSIAIALCGTLIGATVIAALGATQVRHSGEPKSSDTAFRPVLEQWRDGRWERDLQVGVTVLARPMYNGYATVRISALAAIDQIDGDIVELRATSSGEHELLVRFDPSDGHASAVQLAQNLPSSCEPRTILTSPLLLVCANGEPEIYDVASSGAIRWHARAPVPANELISLQGAIGGVARALGLPLTSDSGRAAAREFTINLSNGAIRLITTSNIVVRPEIQGGSLFATALGAAGWIVVSNSWEQGPRCDQISELDNQLSAIWSRYFTGVCFGSDVTQPTVSTGRITELFSEEAVQRIVELRSDGELIWSSKILTGTQIGFVDPPTITSGNNCIQVSGLGDGSLVGEHPSYSATEYAYVVQIDVDNGRSIWKARIPTEISQSHGAVWELYDPKQATCSDRDFEVLDPEVEGSGLLSFPIALVIRGVTPRLGD